MSTTKNKILELQYLRGLSIVGVVLIHITVITFSQITWEKSLSSQQWFPIILNLLARFSVPVFIFISGLLLTYRLAEKKFDYIDFLQKRSRDLLIPYAVWTVLSVIVLIFMRHLSITNVILALFFGKGAFYQLYYIVVLFQLYILAPLILGSLRRFRQTGRVLMVLLLFQGLYFSFFQYSYLHNFSNLPGIVAKLLPLGIQSTFFAYIFYFVCGCYAGKYFDRFTELVEKFRFTWVVLMFVVTFGLQLVDFYWSYQKTLDVGNAVTFYRPSVILFSAASLLLFYRLFSYDNLLRPLITFVGNHSFGIYLSHILFLIILQQISTSFYTSNLLIVITLVLTVLLGVGLNLVVGKIAFGGNSLKPYLVGKG